MAFSRLTSTSARGPRGADEQHRQADEQQGDRHVAPPPGAAVDHVREQVGIREALRVAHARAVPDDVDGDHERHREQRDEHGRRGEAHAPRRPRSQEPGQRAEPVALGADDRVPYSGAGQHRRERSPLLLGGGREAAAQHRARGVHAQLAAGLGIDEPQLARVGELLLARVADLDADHLVPAGDLEQRAAPVTVAAEVRDDDDERALAGELARIAERGLEARPCAARHDAAQAVDQAHHPGTALPRRLRGNAVLAEHDGAQLVAAAGGGIAESERHALRDVRLPAVGGAELHRKRGVDDDPADEDPLGEMHADVRDACPRGRLPVDVPDVVGLRIVRPQLGELGAAPDQLRTVVTGEQPLHAPRQVDVERPEQRLREQPRARPRGGRLGDSKPLRDHSMATRPSACSGRSAAG